MGEILRQWLCTKLGVALDLETRYFGEYVNDGVLLAQLLHSYGVINSEILNTIIKSDNLAVRLNNWKRLQVWMKYIDLDCDDQTIQEVAQGKGSTSLRLFYQVFLCLENKDLLHFITKKITNDYPSSTRFEVKRVSETDIKPPAPLKQHPLSVQLVQKRNIVEWHKVRHEQMLEKWKNLREKHRDILRGKLVYYDPCITCDMTRKTKDSLRDKEISAVRREMDEFSNKFAYQHNLSYKDLVKLQMKGKQNSTQTLLNSQDAMYFVSTIKQRSRKEAAAQALKLKIRKILLTELWDRLMKDQEKSFGQNVVKKLLKQSQYEKQIATKLYQVHQQRKVIVQNRITANKLISEQREKEFTAELLKNQAMMAEKKDFSVFETKRNLELHKRLYEEKMQMKYKKHYRLCAETMNALVDMAVKAAVYKSINNDIIPKVVWNEWKEMFFKGKPIFETIDDLENLIDKCLVDDITPVIQCELERQEILNEHDFEEYMQLKGPWLVEELDLELKDTLENLTIIGYIVHKLLDQKYPLPPVPLPADLPPVTVAAAVVGLTNDNIVSLLRELLLKKEVKVISLEDIINFCLESYKQEINSSDVDKPHLEQATAPSVKDSQLETISNSQNSPRKRSVLKKSAHNDLPLIKVNNDKDLTSIYINTAKYTDGSAEKLPGDSNLNKETQTPKNILVDDAEFVSAKKTLLGKQAFEILNIGQQISSELLVEMLIEYLKESRHMKGWVILNYPNTYSEAALLEKALTGQDITPIEQENDEMEEFEGTKSRLLSNDKLQMDKNRLRISNIVPNTYPILKIGPFKTYLTAYIKLKKTPSEVSLSDEEEIEICQDEESPLERLYTEQGVNYSFNYKYFNLETIKQLARLIIGDFSLPLKSSVELFGEVVNNFETKLGTNDKKVKSGIIKKKVLKSNGSKDKDEHLKEISEVPEPHMSETILQSEKQAGTIEPELSKGKKVKGKNEKVKKENSKKETENKAKEEKNKKNKKKESKKDKKGTGKKDTSEQKVDDKFPQKPNNNNDIEIEQDNIEKDETKDKSKENSSISDIPMDIPQVSVSKPGEENWEYANLNQPGDVLNALASIWENLELVYSKDFKQTLFLKRIHYSKILPYKNFVKGNMENFIKRSDEKQPIIFDFQTKYNEIEDEFRQDTEMKNELHCRVKELESLLLDICDKRKEDSENERRRIINDNWVAEEMGALANLFLTAAQLEVDRFVDTTQLLHDYYITMLKKMPSEFRVEKFLIPRVNVGREANEMVETEVKSRKLKSEASGITRPCDIRTAIAKSLLSVQSSASTAKEFNAFITDSICTAISQVDQINTMFQDIISKEDETLNTTNENLKVEKKKTKKGELSPVVEQIDKETLAIRNASKALFEEWLAGLSNEVMRTTFRLKLIMARAHVELNQIMVEMKSLFHTIHKEIAQRYKGEVESVEALCKVLGNAIEEETPIQQELALDQDKFFVHPNILLYPDPPPPPPPILEERTTDSEFKIGQLELLLEKFRYMSPSGMMPERAFVYVLEDLVVCGTEKGVGKILPKIWDELSPHDIPIVVENIFGSIEYVDWKDFLIYGLQIRFPTQEELLGLRTLFKKNDPQNQEIISLEGYHQVEFWFETDESSKDPQLLLRIKKIKAFLFILFQTKDNFTNYTALLLAFCKDVDPKQGLAKALALSVDGLVRVNEVDSKEHEDEKIKLEIMKKKEELKTFAIGMAGTVLDRVLEDTIQTVEGLTLKEVPDNDEGMVMITDPSCELTVNVIDLEEDKTCNVLYNLTLPDDSEGYKLVVSLPFGVILSVLTTCLPWHARLPFMDEGPASLSERLETAFRELGDQEDSVPTVAFFRHSFVDKLLSKVFKFKICDFSEIISDVISLESKKPNQII